MGICLLVICSISNCKLEPATKASDQVSNINTALPLEVNYPDDNLPNKAKVELGKLLFFDPILSGSKDVACATCHHPNHGYTEFLDVSIGVNGVGLSSKRKFKTHNTIPHLKRNSQSILNTAFNGIRNYISHQPKASVMFWDLRANSLEEQALLPIKTFEEMRGPDFTEYEILPIIIQRLDSIPQYKKLFRDAFGPGNSVNTKNLSYALATFERTLIGNQSRFDQFIRGDNDAISISEQEGFKLFKKVGCANCHNGPMFSDFKPHTLGVDESKILNEVDKGFENRFAFRTPTLRNLRFTAPYMHNGSIKSLKRVLEFYQDISQKNVKNPNVNYDDLDALIHEIDLKVKDMQPIINFLNTLNDDSFSKDIPTNVPSGLQVGGNI